MLPPVWRFWWLYCVILAVLTTGVWIGSGIDWASEGTNTVVLAAGAVVTLISLLTTLLMQWNTSRTQHALSALQTLRTDREYLIAATKLRTHQRLGAPLSREAKAALDADRPILPIPAARSGTPPAFNPTFAEATDFVLNQYEFLAAGIREGAIDYNLLRATQRGAVLGLGLTFADYIRESRDGAPRLWENFVHLFYRFAENDAKYEAIDLGPRPERVWGRNSYAHWLLEA